MANKYFLLAMEKIMYIPVKFKFVVALVAGLMWALFSTYVALGWIDELARWSSPFIAWFVVGGIAIVPGFMNAFLVTSLLFDNRPPRKKHITLWPDISILVAAYNEETSIHSTLESIDRQNYPGKMQVIVINDGSTDLTPFKIEEVQHKYSWLTFVDLHQNGGKSNALNEGLKLVTSNLTITIDGDSYLYKDALVNLVGRYLSDPQNTIAVAGAVLVRNSRKNLVTKVQELVIINFHTFSDTWEKEEDWSVADVDALLAYIKEQGIEVKPISKVLAK